MRYILVNHRRPKVNNYCAFCTASLDDHYLRELDTRIKYCGVGCYFEHLRAALTCIGGYETPKLLAYEKGGLR